MWVLGDSVIGCVSKLFSGVDSEALDRCRVGEQQVFAKEGLSVRSMLAYFSRSMRNESLLQWQCRKSMMKDHNLQGNTPNKEDDSHLSEPGMWNACVEGEKCDRERQSVHRWVTMLNMVRECKMSQITSVFRTSCHGVTKHAAVEGSVFERR